MMIGQIEKDGFIITFEALPEELPLDMLMDNVEQTQKDINSGKLCIFAAKHGI